MTARARARCAAAVAALVLILCGLSAGAPAAFAAEGGTDGLAYVALGDSYAAGYGITPVTGQPVAGCSQADSDYPHLVAKALKLRLTDASCSGAVTANLISTPQNTGQGTARPQSEALGRDTRVVTITIGGNDAGFFSTAMSCVALTATGPILSKSAPNCRSTFVTNGKDALAARIAGPVVDGTSAAPGGLTGAFAAVRAAAPQAKVFVVGYPTIMPNPANTPATGCFRASLGGSSLRSLRMSDGFPFTNVDVAYLASIERDLDVAMRDATQKAGFTYISTLAASATHSACASSSSAYINGITLRSAANSTEVTPGGLHPNARGVAFLVRSVVPEIKNAFPRRATTPTPQPSSAPEWPVLRWTIGLVSLLALLAVAALVIVRLHRRTRDT